MATKRARLRSLPSPPARTAQVGDDLAIAVQIRQTTADHTFANVDWLSSGIIQVQQGVKCLRIDGGEPMMLTAGQSLWIAPGTRLEVRNILADGEYRAQALLLSPKLAEWAAPAAPPPTPTSARRLDTLDVLDAVDRCFIAFRADAPMPAPVQRHRLLELCSWLTHLGLEPFRDLERVKLKVKQLLAEAPRARWRLGAIARRLAMSEDTLQRHLTREGTGFQTLLGEVRMERALLLLWTTERSVALIADDVGYASASRFSTRFRARFGMLPSSLRLKRVDPS